MKKHLSFVFATLLSMAVLVTITSCSKDEEVVQPPIDNNVVTVDANGNADGGHRFTKIDDNNFYIDNIKYTAVSGNLEVTG